MQDSADKNGRQVTECAVVGLTVLAETRLRDEIRRRVPSEPWVDAQFVEIRQRDQRGQARVRRLHDPSVFPPGGAQTKMIRCKCCGIYTPPNAMEDGVCLDHDQWDNWGPSPSAVAIRALQYWNLRLPQTELPPESIMALQLEIEVENLRMLAEERKKRRRRRRIQKSRRNAIAADQARP